MSKAKGFTFDPRTRTKRTFALSDEMSHLRMEVLSAVPFPAIVLDPKTQKVLLPNKNNVFCYDFQPGTEYEIVDRSTLPTIRIEDCFHLQHFHPFLFDCSHAPIPKLELVYSQYIDAQTMNDIGDIVIPIIELVVFITDFNAKLFLSLPMAEHVYLSCAKTERVNFQPQLPILQTLQKQQREQQQPRVVSFRVKAEKLKVLTTPTGLIEPWNAPLFEFVGFPKCLKILQIPISLAETEIFLCDCVSTIEELAIALERDEEVGNRLEKFVHLQKRHIFHPSPLPVTAPIPFVAASSTFPPLPSPFPPLMEECENEEQEKEGDDDGEEEEEEPGEIGSSLLYDLKRAEEEAFSVFLSSLYSPDGIENHPVQLSTIKSVDIF